MRIIANREKATWKIDVPRSPFTPENEKWPIWAEALRLVSRPGDKGIGDVAYRTIGAENSEAFKLWFQITFGRPCGCNGRQAAWNRMYPLCDGQSATD